MEDSVVLPIHEASQVGEARRYANSLAARAGFDEERQGRVALLATEAGHNLVRHARDGELILSLLRGLEQPTIEILALDRGPGMANVDACMRDGFSTAGTSGSGLGALSRMADSFDLWSERGVGTVLVAHVYGDRSRAMERVPLDSPHLQVGGLSVPYPGETRCGDGWASACEAGRTVVMVADGLGHGPAAAEASHGAIEQFRKVTNEAPDEILDAVHQAIRGTRGAAVAVAEIRSQAGEVRFAGVGNISGVIMRAEGNSHMVSHHGTVGHQVRKIQTFSYPWTRDSLMVLHSDGLQSQWKLDRYPGLSLRHPTLIAGTLYRDFKRGRDDTTVVVARELRTKARG